METGLGIEPSGAAFTATPDGFAARGERQPPRPAFGQRVFTSSIQMRPPATRAAPRTAASVTDTR